LAPQSLRRRAQHLTDTPQDVDDFAWSPTAPVRSGSSRPSEEELDAAKTKERGAEAKNKKPKAKKPWVIDRLQFSTTKSLP